MSADLRRPTTKREQREASIEKLLDAGLIRFVRQGYRGTTVEEIAEGCGLTKGSVYFYFKSKEGLLSALLERAEAVVVDAMVRRVSDQSGGGVDKLVAFIHGQARLGVTNPDLVLLLILMSLEFAGKDHPIERRTKAIYERLYRTLEHIIELGKTRGEFRADIRTLEQAAIVMAGHDGTFLEWYRRRAAFEGEELVRALRTSMLAGLMAPQAHEEGTR